MNNNPLWDFSLTVYDRPSVKALLLQLQQDYDADINMLLCYLWLAKDQRLVRDQHFDSLQLISDLCQKAVMKQLRNVRHQLQQLSKDNVEGAELLRGEVLALELRGERWQQDLLWQRIHTFSLQAIDTSGLLLAEQYLEHYCERFLQENGEIAAVTRRLFESALK